MKEAIKIGDLVWTYTRANDVYKVRRAVVVNDSMWSNNYMLRWFNELNGKIVTKGCAFSCHVRDIFKTKNAVLTQIIGWKIAALKEVDQHIEEWTHDLIREQHRRDRIKHQITELEKSLDKETT
mgnify:CR=1 FL=1